MNIEISLNSTPRPWISLPPIKKGESSASIIHGQMDAHVLVAERLKVADAHLITTAVNAYEHLYSAVIMANNYIIDQNIVPKDTILAYLNVAIHKAVQS